jgi:hypothetical protein
MIFFVVLFGAGPPMVDYNHSLMGTLNFYTVFFLAIFKDKIKNKIIFLFSKNDFHLTEK